MKEKKEKKIFLVSSIQDELKYMRVTEVSKERMNEMVANNEASEGDYFIVASKVLFVKPQTKLKLEASQ